jgi:uncharacterized iron-regulated membrane protein
MRLLSLLHRWLGATTGLLLALLGFTGALLVWRDELTFVPHAGDAPERDLTALARIVGSLADGSMPVDRITFAGEGLGVHQAIFVNGGGAYISQTGETVARWSSLWQRPELWLFDLHHHLFLGDAGETATGIAGIIGLAFVVSGIVLWWRMRARFQLRVWPARMTPGAIVHHHRDVGVVTAPLLLVSLLTGIMMVFPAVGQLLLQQGATTPNRAPVLPDSHRVGAHPDFTPLFAYAHGRYPDAEPRRLQWPRKPGAPITLRLRQPSEWTPNGRTFLYFDPSTLAPVGGADPLAAGPAVNAQEKLYPIHAAKVGGLAWRIAITLSGLTLTLLGSLAVYGFWRTRWNVRAARQKRHRRGTVVRLQP